jgi:hypothetical protein
MGIHELGRRDEDKSWDTLPRLRAQLTTSMTPKAASTDHL